MSEEKLLERGYREYHGEEIDVYFNTTVCAHSGNCVKGNKELFDLDRKPWIMPDNVSKEEVKRVINTCPSGALQYIEK
ncbi:(4Fe-4S)-binding protein [Listeria ivanovii subsp. londoniensis]|uniref:(4Fe-4S)-binding protein n=1 Tax=Listeria ivanovii TaxID=1638 RepID=UPI00190438F0|nr:(4Fe-4S)-binding protein [Listeria ivanovii]MBK2003179.1 (4Fe-4S)-binding protein [Listeria ivanovii subsp. londoniensis]